MTRLAAIHTGLDRVRRLRTAVRIGSACSVFGAITLWVLLLAFGLDVATHMSKLERFVVLLLIVPTIVWAFRRYLLPALRCYESDVQLAMVVEKNQGISGDLVAAIQFEDPTRPQYGSAALREAVIDYTSEAAFDLDFLEGFSRKQLSRRAIFASSTLFFFMAVLAAYPGHAMAFFNRLVLGDAMYPTDTVITRVEVLSPGAERPTYGRPLTFRVTLDPRSVHPGSGTVSIVSQQTRMPAVLDLRPIAADGSVYEARLERAMEDLAYQVRLGDAVTRRASIELLMPPVVNVEMRISTPSYAARRFDGQAASRSGRLALEGSRVVPMITSDKPLRSATLTLGEQTYPLRQQGEAWTLDGDDSPLAAVSVTTRYAVQVVDVDGLSLQQPMSGLIQVKADQPPRIAAAAVSQFVVPTALPRIHYEAIDDYALERVTMHVSVIKAPRDLPTSSDAAAGDSGAPDETDGPGASSPEGGSDDSGSSSAASASGLPGGSQRLVLAEPAGREDAAKGVHRLSLASLNVEVGDQVIITLEALDHRGPLPGAVGRSQPVIFQVTDREGVRAAMSELDERMQERIDDIIKAQLGQGAQP